MSPYGSALTDGTNSPPGKAFAAATYDLQLRNIGPTPEQVLREEFLNRYRSTRKAANVCSTPPGYTTYVVEPRRVFAFAAAVLKRTTGD